MKKIKGAKMSTGDSLSPTENMALARKRPKFMYSPTIIKVVGTYPAMVFNQIEYWIKSKYNVQIHDGRFWISKTYNELLEDFYFIGRTAIRRSIEILEKKGYILSFKLNYNHKLYTLNDDLSLCKEVNGGRTDRKESYPQDKIDVSQSDTSLPLRDTSLPLRDTSLPLGGNSSASLRHIGLPLRDTSVCLFATQVPPDTSLVKDKEPREQDLKNNYIYKPDRQTNKNAQASASASAALDIEKSDKDLPVLFDLGDVLIKNVEVIETTEVRTPKKYSKSEIDEMFETFWSSYPRKVSKKSARASFDRSMVDTSLPVILNALEAQKSERAEKENLSIWTEDWKHPATWLNQGCWLDVPESYATIKRRADSRDAPTGYTASAREARSRKVTLDGYMDLANKFTAEDYDEQGRLKPFRTKITRDEQPTIKRLDTGRDTTS